MENHRLGKPNLNQIRKTNRYLADNGGLEITPCVWIHPDHIEVMVVLPDGSLSQHFNRRAGARVMFTAWAAYEKITVPHTDPSWPALSALWPARLSVAGSCSPLCRRRSSKALQ